MHPAVIKPTIVLFFIKLLFDFDRKYQFLDRETNSAIKNFKDEYFLFGVLQNNIFSLVL